MISYKLLYLKIFLKFNNHITSYYVAFGKPYLKSVRRYTITPIKILTKPTPKVYWKTNDPELYINPWIAIIKIEINTPDTKTMGIVNYAILCKYPFYLISLFLKHLKNNPKDATRINILANVNYIPYALSHIHGDKPINMITAIKKRKPINLTI